MTLRKFIFRVASKLTERRIRSHALILGICLWSVYAVDLATPGLRDRAGLLKGTDFMHFYTLGTMANRGQGSELYDMHAQAQLAPELVSDAAGLVYIPLYGPQVSLLFAPLAKLSYLHALIAWWIISAVLYGTSCYLIWRLCPRLRSHGVTVLIAVLAYPAFFALIAWGQSSAPALLAFALAYIALRADRRFLAGLAIGLLAFKPSLGIVAGIIFLLSAEWKIVLGAIVSAAAQIGIGWAHYGTGVMKTYVNALWGVPQNFAYVEPKPYMVHTLRAFWAMLIPQPQLTFALYVASALFVLAMTIMLWRSRAALELKYSGILIATVLVAPHVTFYDLVILVPAFLLLCEWNLEKKTGRGLARINADLQFRSAEVRVNPPPEENPQSGKTESIALLLYLCYGLPLLGLLTRWTHVQLSVLAFSVLMCVIWSARAPGSTP
jgi:alpha-1,2-mannosyltransferase